MNHLNKMNSVLEMKKFIEITFQTKKKQQQIILIERRKERKTLKRHFSVIFECNNQF